LLRTVSALDPKQSGAEEKGDRESIALGSTAPLLIFVPHWNNIEPVNDDIEAYL
jgi:hypothetical protein